MASAPKRKRKSQNGQAKLGEVSSATTSGSQAVKRPRVEAGDSEPSLGGSNAITTQQSSKIFELPAELFTEILSYFPVIPIPTSVFASTPVLSPVALQRSDALRALTQTCRTFRDTLLPLLWQRLEVCAIRSAAHDQNAAAGGTADDDQAVEHIKRYELPGNWYLGISLALKRKSLGLINNPQLASYVQLVNVVLTRCSASTVLTSFVKCLKSLPNAHTLQILHAHAKMTSNFRQHFGNRVFPQIRTAILPSHAHNVLRCLPEVRKVVCNSEDGSKLISAIENGCKKVEEMAGFRPDLNEMKRIIKAAPNVHTFRFGWPPAVAVVEMLEGLKDLSTLEFSYFASFPDRPPPRDRFFEDPMVRGVVRAAKSVLMKSKSDRKKELTVTYYGGSVQKWVAWRQAIVLDGK